MARKLIDWRHIFKRNKDVEMPLDRVRLREIGVNKLMHELDKCGYDEYYKEYRGEIVREIKRRIRR